MVGVRALAARSVMYAALDVKNASSMTTRACVPSLFITSKVLPRSARSLASTGSNSSRSPCAVAFIAASASACEGLAGLVRIATRSKAGHHLFDQLDAFGANLSEKKGL